jgi:hypothetical protein
MRAVRNYWQGLEGRTVLNFNWDAIDNDSVVLVTAAEYSPDAADVPESPRFVGAASVTVRNVAPHGPPYDANHGVTFVVDVAWGSPLNVVTDIVLVEAAEIVVMQWNRLAFQMQTQEQSNWCWCANAVSIANFYGGAWTQGQLANTQLGQTTCTVDGSTAVCNVQSPEPGPLSTVGHLSSWRTGTPTFSEIQTEVDGGRPVSTRIQWTGGGGHFVTVTGYLENTEFITVQDPGGTTSDIRLSTFVSAYNGNGTVDEVHFTKA